MCINWVLLDNIGRSIKLNTSPMSFLAAASSSTTLSSNVMWRLVVWLLLPPIRSLLRCALSHSFSFCLAVFSCWARRLQRIKEKESQEKVRWIKIRRWIIYQTSFFIFGTQFDERVHYKYWMNFLFEWFICFEVMRIKNDNDFVLFVC